MSKQNYLVCLIVAVAVSTLPTLAKAERGDRDWSAQYAVRDVQTVTNSYPLAAGKKAIEVDNIFCSIEVVGTSGDQVRLVLTATYMAETQDRLQRATKAVSLDVSNDNNT